MAGLKSIRLKSEDDILLGESRALLAREIEEPEERNRRYASYKSFKSYKDQVDLFVTELLLQQFTATTVREMSYSISNYSFMRKIVDKLARVYSNGVSRRIVTEGGEINEDETKKLNDQEELLQMNTHLKTCNRYLKSVKNTAFWVKSCKFFDEDGNVKHRVRPTPLFSHLYSVVEEFWDRTKPMGFILSNFEDMHPQYVSFDAAHAGRGTGGHAGLGHGTNHSGDGLDQALADKKEDEGKSDEHDKEFVWWGNKYHFTMNASGEISVFDPKADKVISFNGDISPNDPNIELILNPIGEIPIVDFNIDQDNSYWSEGGGDLTHGSILLNSLITQANHIAVTQGYGQFVATGKDLPSNIPVGPSRGIIANYDPESGEPKPEFTFINANPPLAELWRQIESQAALLLTTNNLSTSGVSTSLDGGAPASSGISLMIDKAESMEDVQDQRQLFVDKEPDIWRIANKWIQFHSEEGDLDPKLEGLAIPEGFDLQVEFNDIKVIQSEGEKLDNLEKRKNLGINEMFELVKMDNPNLSDEDAKAKLERIEQSSMDRMAKFVIPKKDEEESDEEESDNPLEKDDDKEKDQE